jgi:hypothetical protein
MTNHQKTIEYMTRLDYLRKPITKKDIDKNPHGFLSCTQIIELQMMVAVLEFMENLKEQGETLSYEWLENTISQHEKTLQYNIENDIQVE